MASMDLKPCVTGSYFIWPTINFIWVSQSTLGCCHKIVWDPNSLFKPYCLVAGPFSTLRIYCMYSCVSGWIVKLAVKPSTNHYWRLVNQKGLICVSIAEQLLICVEDTLYLLEDFFFWFLLEKTASTRRWVCPPPVLGAGAHSLAREGFGESQFRRGDIHCGTHYIYVYFVIWPRFSIFWTRSCKNW